MAKVSCVSCGIEKPVKEFYKRRKDSAARRKVCKVCQKKVVVNRYWDDPVARRKEKQEDRKANPVRHMLVSAKQRAKRTGVTFDLNMDDVVIPRVCPCFGITLVQNTKVSCAGSATLDQIEPGRGYVRGNVQVISLKANTMKSNATFDELKLFASWVLSLKRGGRQ